MAELERHPTRGQPEHRLARRRARQARAGRRRARARGSAAPRRARPPRRARGSCTCSTGRSMLSRVRTSGITMPSSSASLRRSARTRSRRSPPLLASTRSTRSNAISSSSGSTRMSVAMRSGASGESGGGSASSVGGGRLVEDLLLRRQPRREDEQQPADDEERQLRQSGHDRDDADRAARELQRALVARELLQQVGAEVALGRGAGDDQARRQRDQQRRDLRDETVTDRQQAVLLRPRRRTTCASAGCRPRNRRSG